jgi:thiol-disulfide isomerase/thioredoxin
VLDAILLGGRLVLAAVFATAGVAKLADRDGARRAAIGFGAPERLAGPVAFVLPLGELAVAGAVLPAGSARWGALGALSLLGVFTAAIAVNLALGRTPDCHCFGQLHSAPAGPSVLVRNLALAGVAGAVVFAGWNDPGPDGLAWIDDLEGATLAAAVAAGVALVFAAAAVWAFLHVMRSYGRVLIRLDRLEAAVAGAGIELEEDDSEADEFGLPVGVPAPQFEIVDLLGRTVALPDLLAGGRRGLLVFAEQGCGPCQALMPQVAAWQRDYADQLAIAVVGAGRPADVRAEAEEHELGLVLLDTERLLHSAFEAAGTPSAVLIHADATIGSGVAAGAAAIQGLVERALAADESESALSVGEPVPALRLRDLGGRDRALTRLVRDRDTIVLFWNPGCGFCRAMHDELLDWENNGADRPALVVVSSGDPEAVRAEGFTSSVVLDPDFSAGAAFGAGGTPAAVLVDARGKIASRVVAGAEDVFALTRIPRAVVS